MRQRIDVFYAGNEGLAGQFTFNGQYTGNTLNGKTTNGHSGSRLLCLALPEQLGVGAGGGTWGQRSSISSGLCARRLEGEQPVDHQSWLALGVAYALERSR